MALVLAAGRGDCGPKISACAGDVCVAVNSMLPRCLTVSGAKFRRFHSWRSSETLRHPPDFVCPLTERRNSVSYGAEEQSAHRPRGTSVHRYIHQRSYYPSDRLPPASVILTDSHGIAYYEYQGHRCYAMARFVFVQRCRHAAGSMGFLSTATQS